MIAPARAGFAPGRAALPAGRHFGGAPGFHGGAGFGSRRFFFHHHHRSFFRSGCFNGFCNPGYYIAPPIFWPTYDYSPASDYGMQSYAAAPAYDDSALRAQIQHLTDEVEQLREEQHERYLPPQPAAPARPSRMDLPTILVFRGGKRTEVQNYGIVGQTLWTFSEQHAKKVPLADLDLIATQRVSDERGVGFVLPEKR